MLAKFFCAAACVLLVNSTCVAESYCYQYSCWQTKYHAPNGQWVDAVVKLNGTTGTYKTSSFTGQLTNITVNWGSHSTTIDADWSVNQSSGHVSWTVSNNNPFECDGHYTINGQNPPPAREWNGWVRCCYSQWYFDPHKHRYYCKCHYKKQNGQYAHSWCISYPNNDWCYYCHGSSYWGKCKRQGSWKRWHNNGWSNWNQPTPPQSNHHCCVPCPPVPGMNSGTDPNIPMTPIPATNDLQNVPDPSQF